MEEKTEEAPDENETGDVYAGVEAPAKSAFEGAVYDAYYRGKRLDTLKRA